jgi:hypothetical protein
MLRLAAKSPSRRLPLSSNVRRLNMSLLDKWADRIYAESDFGRSVATSIAGALGLGTYLFLGDWVIAAFAAVISFPLLRMLATALHKRVLRRSESTSATRQADEIYESLSETEKEVVLVFVEAGGCVITWGQMNQTDVSGSAIESLIQRDLLSTSVTADGVRETFVIGPAVYDAARRAQRSITAA